MENLRGLEDNPRHRFVKGDVVDVTVVGPLVAESDYVIHFAAETHVDRSIKNAGDFITTDVFGTFVLLDAARESSRLRRFVQISTDEVYGSVPEGASLETDELKPRNPYAATKAGADRLAYSYFATYEVPVIITEPRTTTAHSSSRKRSSPCSLPTRSTSARCRSTATANTYATGCTSTTTAARSIYCFTEVSRAMCTTSVAATR